MASPPSTPIRTWLMRQDQHPAGDLHEFLRLGRGDQDAAPGFGGRAQGLVDVASGADVHALCRLVEQQQPAMPSRVEPTRDDELLLVAARKAPRLEVRAARGRRWSRPAAWSKTFRSDVGWRRPKRDNAR